MRNPCLHPIAAAIALITMTVAVARADGPLDDLAAFQKVLSPSVATRLDMAPKHYRQIEPSVYYLAAAHAARIEPLKRDDQVEMLVTLARFIDAHREATGNRVVIGKGREVIGLLDPDRGLDPKEITTISRAYGATSTIFKRATEGDTIRSVADAFLDAVSRAARGRTPTTIVVLGHGLPDEIQSYSISCARLADAFIPDSDAAVDLGHVVLILDDCYSADFSINLAAAIERRCRERSRPLTSLPVMIAGTNRNSVGHADFGSAFVPHFWKDVIELYYIRRPRQAAITLRDFFDKVDGMMYGYGRTTTVEPDGTVSYRLVDPKLCQDPVVFIPLDDEDLGDLRAILDLPAEEPLPRLLDIG